MLPVIYGGRTLFQPMHVADAVLTLRLVLERPATAGLTLALVGAETFTFRELLEQMLAVVGQRRTIVSVPLPVAQMLAAAIGWLPMAPLTPEEVRLLRTNKVASELPTPAALGIAARPLSEGLPASLRRPR